MHQEHFNYTLPQEIEGRSSDTLKTAGNALFYSLNKLGEVKKLSQNIVLKTTPSKTLLSLNMQNINQLFPGFATGDFALLYGSHAVSSIASLLCIRAQLPPQLGGLGSNIVFIDGANTFRLSRLSNFAREHQTMIIATYPPHQENPRNNYLQTMTYGRANVVLSLRQTKYDKEIVLEKHPTPTLGSAELPSEVLLLTAFMEA